MKFKYLLPTLMLLFSISTQAQLTVRNPEICHTTDGYLKCYNDGFYKLFFSKGNFKYFVSADSSIRYSEDSKTIAFIPESLFNSSQVEMIEIQLLSHSILLKKGKQSLNITSMQDIPSTLNEFSLNTYSSATNIKGFTFYAGGKFIKIEINTSGKQWSWDIVLKENQQFFIIAYNVFRNNRVQHIFVQNDSLRYGMSVSMTFKSLKKIWFLKADYVEKVQYGNKQLIKSVPLDNAYKYEYKRNGKLKTNKSIGNIKVCECQ